jgi:sugar lactone lactonase YvrE
MNPRCRAHSFTIASIFNCLLCLGLAACGGGGGGGNTTVTPPLQQQETLSVLAGSAGGYATTDGIGSSARFVDPNGIAIDPAGNLYVTDTRQLSIRKVTPAGVVTTVAGTVGVVGSVNGPGAVALFSNPTGIACDAAGNVYVADGLLLRKITPAGLVSTFAGGTAGSADGTGTAAQISNLEALTIDGSGNLYAVDYSSNNGQSIRKITPAGVVTTLAPTVERFGIGALAADQAGNLYIASSDKNIRFVTTTGVASVIAAYPGSNNPDGITIGAGGNLFVTDVTDDVVRMVTPAGVVTTLAGTAGSPGNLDGTGAAARFNRPMGIVPDTTGNLYVADWLNGTIRKIAAGGVVTTFAGEGPSLGDLDGVGSAAQFNSAYGIAAGPGGNLYVADNGNAAIRLVTPAGVVSTLVSAAALGSNAQFSGPAAIAVDGAGNAFFVDAPTRSIFKLDTSGNVTLIAGNSQSSSSVDGTGAAASFNDPNGIAVDAAGNLYVTDAQAVLPAAYHRPVGSTIRKITPGGVVTTIAGSASVIGSTDGVGSAALFYNPAGILADAHGNLYVTDRGNNSIRKLSPGSGSSGSAYSVTTFAGVSGQAGEVDGPATAALFSAPNAITMDSMGNLYVLDGTAIIRKIAPDGTTTTLWGNENLGGFQIVSQPGTYFDGFGIALIDDHDLAISSFWNILKLTMP